MDPKINILEVASRNIIIKLFVHTVWFTPIEYSVVL